MKRMFTIHCIAGLLAGTPAANCADAGPADLAAHLEATLVGGAGVLFPDASLSGTLHAGAVAMDDSWPAAFLAHAGETLEVSVSSETGWYEFRDAAGDLFWVEIPVAPLTTDWIAPALRPGADPATAALLSPFRLSETWTLAHADAAETRDSGNPESRPGNPGCRKSGIPALRSISPDVLAFTAFSATPSNLLFTASWPTNGLEGVAPAPHLPIPGGLLDLYVSTNLASPRWSLLHTESGATNPPVAFSLPADAIPGWGAGAPHVHDASCPAATNVVLSPLDGETAYTNIAYLCDAPPPATEAAFFRLGTRADADGDGLPDAFESLVAGTDPALPDTDGDGVHDAFDPEPQTPAAGTEPGTIAPNLASVLVFPPLAAADHPAGATTSNSFVATRAGIPVHRTGSWQRYYLSGSPTNAAPVLATNVTLMVYGAGGTSNLATYAAADLALAPWIPAAPGEPSLDVLLCGDLAGARLDSPLHLVAWAPDVSYSHDSGVVTGVVDGVTHYVAVGGEVALRVLLDHSSRPSLAPESAAETSVEPFEGVAPLAFDDVSGTLAAPAPGAYDLPTIPPALPEAPFAANWLADAPPDAVAPATTNRLLVIDPSLEWRGNDAPQGRMARTRAGAYSPASPYPLETAALRQSVLSSSDGTPGAAVLSLGADADFSPLRTTLVADSQGALATVFLVEDPPASSAEPDAEPSGARAVRLFAEGPSAEPDGASTNIVWTDWQPRGHRCESPFPDDSATLSGMDAADECGCGDLAGTEGDSLRSFAFRIPLGFPRPGQIAGFLWLHRDEPGAIGPGDFHVTAREDAFVSDAPLAGGGRRVACPGERGRSVDLVPAPAGGLVATVRDAASGALLHSWEFSRPSSDAIRLRRITRGGNVQRDVTYAGGPGAWSRTDHACGAVETLTRLDDLAGPTGLLAEERVLADAAGTVLSHTVTESRRIGGDSAAVLREVARRTLAPGGVWLSATASYWEDPGNPMRNGRPRLVAGDDRPWSWSDYDADGRETLRLDQLDGSAPPVDDEYAADSPPDSFDHLRTITSYDPLPGDSADPMDERTPRTVSRHIARAGEPPVLIARAWTVVTRGSSGGVPTVTRRTERAHAQAAVFGDPSNAVSESTAHSSAAAGVPLLLRGRPVAETDESGVTTHWAYDFGAWDTGTRSFAESGDADAATHLRIRSWRTTAAAPQGVAWRTTVSETIEETAHGNEVWSATRVLVSPPPAGFAPHDDALSAPFDWESRTFDEQDRLRHTLHSDGSSSTNDYSCCRLLSTIDREGRTVLRSAVTGQDHLYWAEEADLPRRDASRVQFYANTFRGTWSHPVTQHFLDPLGRETNTVRCAATGFGIATNDAALAPGGLRMRTETLYPAGVAGLSRRTDVRGLVAQARELPSQAASVSVRETWASASAPAPESIVTNTVIRNGGSLRETHWRDGSWTRERSFDAYAANGTRTACSVTETSDGNCATNSVTHFDFLGRVAEVHAMLSSVSCAYDGASPTAVSATDAVSGATTDMLHDPASGEKCGTASLGVTNAMDVAYALFGGELWRISSEAAFSGAATNALSTRRERLTGLSDALRSHSVEETLGGPAHERRTWFDAARTNLVELLLDSATGFRTNTYQFGRLVRVDAPGHTDHLHCDGLGRNYTTLRAAAANRDAKGGTVSYLGYGPTGDIDFEMFAFKDSRFLWTDYARDAHGRITAVTDSLGGIETRVYDARGHRAETGGSAAFPAQSVHDALGRRISLATSRDGSTWDTSSWMRDPATGLCMSKTYADGSSVAYTHTPDGLPQRTTWARGAWRESAYDAARREIGRHYSDPSLDCAFERDIFGALSSASNAVAQTAFLRDNPGMPTNETHAIAGDSFAIRRAYDANGRLASLEWAADGDAASRRVAFAYDGEGRLSTVSNESFSASYAYHAHGHELGYTLTLSSGAKVVRSVSRLTRPPNTVTAVTNFFVSASGETNALPSFAYALDDLLRPVARNADSFGYDARSQLTSATLRSAQTNAYAYAYDNAGNRTAAAEAGIATSYTANSLNQYTAVSSDVPAYDADGNLLALGDWSYAWDAENRLATAGPTAPEDGSLRVRNEYDAFSRRVVKRVDRWHDGTGEWRPWETHAFLYDGWNVVREEVRDESGTLTTTLDYHWGRDLSGTLQGAGGVGGLLAYTRNGALRIPLHDHLGNVVAVVDESGVPVAAYEYDPFGNIVSSSGPEADAVPFRFSTKYFDSETGLYYYGYRFYSPELGRWINRDPIEEEGGENLHVFCGNNSTYFIDEFGALRVTGNDAKEAHDVQAYFEMARQSGIFAKIVNAVREPLKSAIRTHFWTMHFHLSDNSRDPHCEGLYGYSPHVGFIQDVEYSVVHTKSGQRLDTPVHKSERKHWYSYAVLCTSQLCRKNSKDNWLLAAIHETAHNIGWGNPYRDVNDSSFDNLPPFLDIHHRQGSWGIPSGNDK